VVWRRFEEGLRQHGIELSDVANADEMTLGGVLEELGFRGIDKALLVSNLAKARGREQTGHNTTGTDLVDNFRAERARVVEPWRNAAEKGNV